MLFQYQQIPSRFSVSSGRLSHRPTFFFKDIGCKAFSNRSSQLGVAGVISPVSNLKVKSNRCSISFSERICFVKTSYFSPLNINKLKKAKIGSFRSLQEVNKMTMVIAGMNFTCMVDSLSKFELPDKDCFVALFAKALGYAIIVASTIVKLPQILVILKSHSIQGLSIPSFEMELVGYTIALSYCLFKQLPFSAFGELLFLLIQAVILIVLIYYHSPRRGPLLWLKAGIYTAIAPVLFSGKLDAKIYDTLYTGQTALFTLSRIPQMWSNYSSRSTGQLSLATTFMNFAGCIARLFTSLQAKAPITMVVGSILGMICHGTLLGQILFYSSRISKKVEKEKKVK